VPAAAVIQKARALFGMIGRKASVGGFTKSTVKYQGLTLGRQWKLGSLSTVGAEGILGGAVKCIDIEENTNGESTLLGRY
jgi:hypothetical protein